MTRTWLHDTGDVHETLRGRLRRPPQNINRLRCPRAALGCACWRDSAHNNNHTCKEIRMDNRREGISNQRNIILSLKYYVNIIRNIYVFT